jgi:glyoxylase-like metal-dependent hydrolase (beta-lactamase superfamily II)
MSNKISIDVFVGAENAFHVTSTIVSGERDAVLIDAQFTRSDARRLAERIKAIGKNLTTVYVTHGHPDHYWGFTTLYEQFPRARFVTAPEVVPVIDETLEAKVAQWKPMYRDEVPDAPIKPKALDGDTIDLEGNELSIIHLGQGDTRSSTVVWIQPLSTIVTGDVAYNGTHSGWPRTAPISACNGSKTLSVLLR